MWEAILQYKTYFFTAFAILIPLLGYAVYLQYNTFSKLKGDKQQERERFQAAYDGRQDNLQESIRIIAMATIQEQCEISEACLRIANLLPHLDMVDHTEEVWAPLFSMHKEIKGLKIKDDRKALKAAERFKEDKIRFEIEDKYHQDILAICKLLYEKTRGPNPLEGAQNEPS